MDAKKFIFDFERLEVYQLAIEFIDNAFSISMNFNPKLQSSLGDQLRRASLSIANNIAEGNGKNSRVEKVKYFNYSLDSAKECIPIITIALRQKQICEDVFNNLREYCARICQMLLKLIKSI